MIYIYILILYSKVMASWTIEPFSALEDRLHVTDAHQLRNACARTKAPEDASYITCGNMPLDDIVIYSISIHVSYMIHHMSI